MSTIGEAIDANETISVNCHDPRCQHMSRLDLDALARQLGRDHGVMHQDIAHLFRCERCATAGRPPAKVGLTRIPDYKASLASSWARKPD
jgi:hypothetical protein